MKAKFNLTQIQSLTDELMTEVNHSLVDCLKSEVALIDQISHYIIHSGGKRIRPLIALLSGQAVNIDGKFAKKVVKVAAFIELIHTATLLHDDVVDESELRRGRETSNAVFGNAASVLVGDFIYTRSFQMMTDLDSIKILKIMSDATNVIAQGEVEQLINCNDVETTEDRYFSVIYGKTARLFEAACQCSALVCETDEKTVKALQDYGRYLGSAFQVMDDILDYQTSSEHFGKNLGDDFVEGKPTLPLIHALQNAHQDDKDFIKNAIINGGKREDLPKILQIFEQLGSLDYAKEKALAESKKAAEVIECLPNSDYKDALISLAILAVKRDY